MKEGERRGEEGGEREERRVGDTGREAMEEVTIHILIVKNREDSESWSKRISSVTACQKGRGMFISYITKE